VAIDTHELIDRVIRATFNLKRSSDWSDVQKTFKAAHPKCAACGATEPVNVHHMFPFHFVVLCGRPDLELDPRNLITLCTEPRFEHHLLLGHLDDFESYNPDVKKFVKTDSKKTSQQIQSEAGFQKAHATKPKHLQDMTEGEKAAFKQLLDTMLPADAAIVAKAAKARAAKARAAAQ
jgi:hypothetical protein